MLWSIYWNNNPWSQPPSQRAGWADNLDVPIFDPDLHEYLLFIGCRDKSVDHYKRGTAHAKKGEPDQAISYLNKAIEINPRHAGAYYNRGLAYYNKREYDKAWEDVHKAQSLGYQVHPEVLKKLREASGRER